MSIEKTASALLFCTIAAVGAFAEAGETRRAGDDAERLEAFRRALKAPVERAGDRIAVRYDFRHTQQTMDFENGLSSGTITVSGSGSMKLGEYQESGRLGFAPGATVRWKSPHLDLSSVKLSVERARDLRVEFAAPQGGVQIAIGAVTQIVVTGPDGKQTATKAIEFPLDPSKSYRLEARVEKASIVLLVDDQKALKAKLPDGLGALRELRLGSGSKDIRVATLEITGALPGADEAGGTTPVPEPLPKPAPEGS